LITDRMSKLRLPNRALHAVVAVLATAALVPSQAHAGLVDKAMALVSGKSEGGKAGLTLATWNMEWLMTPATYASLAPTCTRQQPASNERAFPCTPGHTPPPQRTAADFEAMGHTATALLKVQQADLIGLQEADGPEAAKLVFRQGYQLDCFVKRAHPQKVGFAIREGIPYRCNGDLRDLDIDGSTRAGADISLWPGTSHEVRVLAVHLKSGCFAGKLDRSFQPCQRLRRQVPVVEAWIDQRIRDGVALAVLGDFNRHLDKDARYPAGPDEEQPFNLWQAWSDQNPPGADLMRATEGQPYLRCNDSERHSQYIDDIVIDRRLGTRFPTRRFARQPDEAADQGRQLSDHCPVVWALKP
jgi:endonuclease/exonuclease/phosphatase family metal-dependent hydrolase